MIVAVIAMWMVQVVANEIIDVIAVRDGFVAAVRPVDVLGVVLAALVLRRALGRVLTVDRQDVLFHAVAGLVVQVAIVQIIDVVVVTNRCMSAARSVAMGMVRVFRM